MRELLQGKCSALARSHSPSRKRLKPLLSSRCLTDLPPSFLPHQAPLGTYTPLAGSLQICSQQTSAGATPRGQFSKTKKNLLPTKLNKILDLSRRLQFSHICPRPLRPELPSRTTVPSGLPSSPAAPFPKSTSHPPPRMAPPSQLCPIPFQVPSPATSRVPPPVLARVSMTTPSHPLTALAESPSCVQASSRYPRGSILLALALRRLLSPCPSVMAGMQL